MVLRKNDNASKLSIYFSVAEHFLPTRRTLLDNPCHCQGYNKCHTGTLQVAHIRFAAPCHL